MNAWVRKEIRDAARWAPLGIFVLASLLWYSLYKAKTNPSAYLQLSSSMYALVWFVSAAFATFLGLANHLPETFGSARGFLVQRGISLQQIFFIRSVVNFIVYLVAMLVPIGVVAIYLSVIGPFDAPVSPIQVVPSMGAVLYCFSFYFGAVAVACRPSRWFGSRLLPLLAAMAVSVSSMPIMSLATPVMVFVTIMPMGIVGILMLMLTGRHTFLRGPSYPAPSRTRRNSLYEIATLVLAVVAANIVLGGFVMYLLSVPVYLRSEVRFTEQGVPWSVDTSYHYVNGSEQKSDEVKIALMEPSDNPTSKPALSELRDGIRFYHAIFFPHNHWDMDYVGAFKSKGDLLTIVGDRGLLYLYNTRLIAVIGKDAVGDLWTAKTPFQEIPRLLSQYDFTPGNRSSSFAVAASDGIYQIDLDAAKIDRLLESKLHSIAFVDGSRAFTDSSVDQPNKLIISDGDSISIYSTTGSPLGGKISIPERVATLDIPTELANHLEDGILYFSGSDNWTLVRKTNDQFGKSDIYVTRSGQKDMKHFKAETGDSLAIQKMIKRDATATSLVMPPIVMAMLAVVSYWDTNIRPGLFDQMGIVFAHALLSGILATLAARRRRLTAKQCAAWFVTGLFIGLGTWIVVLSAYPRVVVAKCPSCSRKRRLDRDRCEACGSVWEPQSPIGIELFQRGEPIAEPLVA